MTTTIKHQMVLQTTTQRDQAEALLRVLLDAKACSERNLRELRQPDFMKQVTGRSSMDNAIASTQRLIETFNRVLDDLRADLNDDDLALLAEIEHDAVGAVSVDPV